MPRSICLGTTNTMCLSFALPTEFCGVDAETKTAAAVLYLFWKTTTKAGSRITYFIERVPQTIYYVRVCRRINEVSDEMRTCDVNSPPKIFAPSYRYDPTPADRNPSQTRTPKGKGESKQREPSRLHGRRVARGAPKGFVDIRGPETRCLAKASTTTDEFWES